MTPAALLCALGLPAGFLLIWRVPTCAAARPGAKLPLSIVIPARNEAKNLPRLLQSIQTSATQPMEVLVVDDASTDDTALLARKMGATVIASAPLPAGWTGKSWACDQGARNAAGELLLFLDADTYFLAGGLDRVMARWLHEQDRRVVLSLLPYHSMNAVYEQLSLFFNVLMAAGAGGFGPVTTPRLFGQSLLMDKELYFAAGGHASVRGLVLENLRFAHSLRGCGAHLVCLGGHGALHMRMFPDGLGQMSESWTKAFIQGAVDSGGFVLALAIAWISALWSSAFLLIVPGDHDRFSLAVVYLLYALQLSWLTRHVGRYRSFTCLLYPVPLAYYCVVFGRSALRRLFGRKNVWRGREV
jgi:4,4'-diaponeurosporenoate glycosyltransferase